MLRLSIEAVRLPVSTFQPFRSSIRSISSTPLQPSFSTIPSRWINHTSSLLRQRLFSQSPVPSPCHSGLLGVAGLGFSSLLLLQTRTALCQEFGESKKNRVQAFRDAQKAIQVGVENASFDWKLFWAFLRPDIWLIIGAIACSVCLAIINTEIPSLLGRLVNVIAQEAPKQPKEFAKLVRGPVSKLFGIYFLHAGFTFVNISLLFTLGERLAARIRLALFSNLLQQDIAFFDSHKTGELINRLAVDVQELKSNFKHVFVNGFRTVLQIIGGAVSLFWISPQMAGLLLIGLPAMAGLGNKLGESLRTVSKEAQAQAAHATDVAEEALSNVRTVRGFAAEETETHLYNDEVQKSVRLNNGLGVGIGIFQALSNLAVNGAVLGVIYVGGSFLAEGKLLPGDLMSFMVTSQAIQRSIANLSMLFGQVVNGMSSGARVFEFIKLKPTVSLTGGWKIPYHSLKGSIEFEHVGFSYPTRKDTTIFSDLSLQIPADQVVALCGPSGSGKSTIAALLERFYDPLQGRITLDGVDIRQLDPSWLRGRVIGYISQEPTLFATSIIENIRYGRPDATDSEVFEAAKAANAHDFISEFPKGYQTVLGERGVTVSGGQKQRIAIARALLKNPSILILDEATSALDSESEKFVQEALDRAAKGRTVLVIAHRLSTIQNANAIALIVDGKIREFGSHQELMNKRGMYWQFVQHQSVAESTGTGALSSLKARFRNFLNKFL